MKRLSHVLAIYSLGKGVGLRSLTPLAALTLAAGPRLSHSKHKELAWLGSPVARWLIPMAAAGELVADKLPGTPSRTAPALYAFRILQGGLAGAALADLLDFPVLQGALVGALGATWGTWAAHEARQRLVEYAKCPDWQVALGEDLTCIGVSLGCLAANHLLPKSE